MCCAVKSEIIFRGASDAGLPVETTLVDKGRPTAPSLMLVTPVLPGMQGVGGLFLGDLCRFLPKPCKMVLVTEQRSRSSADFSCNLPSWLVWLDARGHRGRVGKFLRRLPGGSTLSGLASAFAWLTFRVLLLNRLVRKLEELKAEWGVQEFWFVIEGPLMVFLVQRVASRGHRVRMTVWDPPGAWIQYQGYDDLTVASTREAFKDVISRVARCGVPSHEMSRLFKRDYGVESVTMIHGLEPRVRVKSVCKKPEASAILIGFAGSMHCTAEWNVLMEALDSCAWQINGKPVRVRFCGSFKREAALRPQVDVLGYLPVEKVINEMSICDIAYLPYWFDDKLSEIVRYAFPNKLSAYVAAGVPTLFHGPANSSVVKFFAEFPIGNVCTSMEPYYLLASIRYTLDSEQRIKWSENINFVFENMLSLPVFRSSLAAFLDIDQNQLVPLVDS